MHSAGTTADATPYSRRGPAWLIAFCLAFQWLSRYSGAPVVDFTLDDWRLLQLGQSCHSLLDACQMILRWPDRPFATPLIIYLYHAFGENITLYALFSWFVTALFLLFALLATYELTGSRFVTAATGVLFSLLPNLTESFHWYTMTAYGLGFAAYPACAWLWIRYLKTGAASSLVGSALLFLFALGTYEVGVALPAVLLVLALPRPRPAAWVGAAVLSSMVVLYLAWRFSHGFGLSHDLLFPHRTLSLAQVPWLWNLAEAARWWVGDHAREILLNGSQGFALRPSSTQHAWTTCFVALMGAACFLLLRWGRGERAATPTPHAFPPARVALFAAAWFAGTQVTNLVSWSGPRLCYVPAWGAALLLALLCARLRAAVWMPLLVVAGLVSLAANHGTARHWHDSAVFQRRIFAHLGADRPQWEQKDVILLDTRGLRNRLHEGLMDDTPQRSDRFGFYGNAGLLRGFAVKAMADLVAGGRKTPNVILDAEFNARIVGPNLVCDGWYDPAGGTTTALDRVYIVDCLRFTAEGNPVGGLVPNE